MKKIITLFFIFTNIIQVNAQKNERTDHFYTMSGFGFTFPIGETNDYLSAKFSNTLGLNIALGSTGGWFLYPKINLHAFKFDQLVPENGNPYLVKSGRSTTYVANLNLGHRFTKNQFSYYGYLGLGGGIILTKRGDINQTNGHALLRNESNTIASLETGAGIEYKMGTFILFSEMSYWHGFLKIEQKDFNLVPLTVGFKTDLSKVFRKN